MTQPASRRSFLQSSASLAAAAGATTALVGVHSELAAAETPRKMPVALVGPGGMGSGHLSLLARNPALEVAYVCDPDANRLEVAVKAVEKVGGKTPQAVKDMRKIRDDKNVEAVWIATPDHWHAPAAILMADAKKHVYVEKPCSHNLREGRLMIEAARRNNIQMQVGTQTRSTPHVQQAVAKLREGAIGEILAVKAWNSQKRGSIGHQKASTPPANLDYDLWLGPVPEIPYQSNFLHSIWRWWYAFGAGDIGNDGVHDIDVALWGLGATTHPTTIAALGGKYFFDDDQQWPDTQYVAFEYPVDANSKRTRQLIFEQRIWSPYVQEGYENGNAFYGTNGMMVLGKFGGWQIFGPKNTLLEAGKGSPDLAAHHQNFLDAIAGKAKLNASIETNHLSTSLCHLANISTRLRRTLTFDPKKETFPGDEAANKLLSREYRPNHWAAIT